MKTQQQKMQALPLEHHTQAKPHVFSSHSFASPAAFLAQGVANKAQDWEVQASEPGQ